MSSEEETFFMEARVPVHLAAAAYSGDEEFRRLRFIDHGNLVERNSMSKLLRPFIEHPDRWNGIAVHVAVIPVKLQSNGSELGSDRNERHNEEEEGEEMCWDLALVYRGTQPFSVTNWITDLTFEQEPVEDYILRHPDLKQQNSLLVHRGFHQAFKTLHPDPQQSSEIQRNLTIQEGCLNRIDSAVRDVKEQIKRKLEPQTTDGATMPRQLQSRSTTQRLRSRLATCLDNPSPRRVLCIGHSLGGALAILAAAWCKSTLCQGKAFRDSQVHCITIGAPRVGNPAFAQAWNELLLGNVNAAAYPRPRPSAGLCYRIVHALDPVPSVPPAKLFGDSYQHVGTPVYLERRVDNWNTDVVAHLRKERPWVNCVSVRDHFQWNYTAALDAAEVHMSSDEGGASGDSEGKKDMALHGWLYWLAKQLKPADLWEEFRDTLRADISIMAHFWIMLFWWGLGALLPAVVNATLFGMLFVYFLLLPVVTFAFAHDCVMRALGLRTKPTGYKFGNLCLALLSVLVMVLTNVSVWFGL